MISYYNISNDGELVMQTREETPLKPGNVRVDVKSVAFNPIDYKVKLWGMRGIGLGSDFAGVVTAVGDGVNTLRVGDEVAGWVPSADPSDPTLAGFSTQVDHAEDALIRFKGLEQKKQSISEPKQIFTFEQASSIAACLTTAAIGYAINFNVPLVKDSQKGWVLVYGASSSVGFNAAQLGKWLGFEVIAIASEKHFGMLRTAGIEHLIDYHDQNWPQKARKLGDIRFVLDPIATPTTTKQVLEAVSTDEPVKIVQYNNVDYSALNIAKNVEISMSTAYLWYEVEKTIAGMTFRGKQELLDNRLKNFQALSEFCETAISLPITVAGTSLSKVPQGIEQVKSASGEKIVLSI